MKVERRLIPGLKAKHMVEYGWVVHHKNASFVPAVSEALCLALRGVSGGMRFGRGLGRGFSGLKRQPGHEEWEKALQIVERTGEGVLEHGNTWWRIIYTWRGSQYLEAPKIGLMSVLGSHPFLYIRRFLSEAVSVSGNVIECFLSLYQVRNIQLSHQDLLLLPTAGAAWGSSLFEQQVGLITLRPIHSRELDKPSLHPPLPIPYLV